MNALVQPLMRRCEFGDLLQVLIAKYTTLWNSTSDEIPDSVRSFTPEEQDRNKLAIGRLIAFLEKELPEYPEVDEERAAWRKRIFDSLRGIGTGCFEFPERHFDIIFSEEYFEVTRKFVGQARLFDRTTKPEALAQALRNVWVMNLLQMFLGGKPSLSPSIFAYSMLYPLTDNYLDQPGVSREIKTEACRRLGLRLEGKSIKAGGNHERAVFRLIEMIEAEYPRQDFPEVHDSLRAIHEGQVKSLSQQQGTHMPAESSLLRISVEKGGSSVLADGWLVTGRLTPDEAEFFFGLGVMLQLLDDLQDLPDDRTAEHWTLFSCSAASGKLDRLTSRLWHFLDLILDASGTFQSPRGAELKDLMQRNSRMLLLRAVAQNADFYNSDYLSHMEGSSPLRLSWLRDMTNEAEGKFRRLWPSLARRRNLHSVFDLLD